MAQEWPTGTPTVDPTVHDEVAQQAYQAGGGDYFRAGYYSNGFYTSAATATVAMGLNSLLARPFLVPVRRAFDRIGLHVTTAATAGGVLRMGIYANGGGKPGSLVLDAGTVASDSTGAKQITIAQTLDPGVYWLAAVAQTATCTVTGYAALQTTPFASPQTVPPSGLSGWGGVFQSSVSGALPNPFVVTDAQVMTAVCLRAT